MRGEHARTRQPTGPDEVPPAERKPLHVDDLRLRAAEAAQQERNARDVLGCLQRHANLDRGDRRSSRLLSGRKSSERR